MPGDERDEIGSPNDGRGQAKPPCLCTYHRQTVSAMGNHGHVDPEHTTRAAQDIARQCPECQEAA
jgi:hypothetical protein